MPYDSFSSDLTTADSLQVSVNFSFDGYPFRSSEGATDACLEAYKSLGHNSLMDGYENALIKGPRQLSGVSSR